MRFITKRDSPIEFERWKEQDNPKSWSEFPTNKIDPTRAEEGTCYYSRAELRAHLLIEQESLCGYCESKVINKPFESKLEHILPQENNDYASLRFNYNNIIVVCSGGEVFGKKGAQLHCDSAKKDQEIAITPLVNTCEEEIKFTLNGNIYSNTAEGENTIEILNLSLAKLNILRQNAIYSIIYNDIDNSIFIDKEEAIFLYNAIESKELILPFVSSIRNALQRIM